MGIREALEVIKVKLGLSYNRSTHNFNYNTTIKEGELKPLGNNEFFGMSKGSPIYCKKLDSGKMICKKIAPKLLKGKK